MATHDTLFFSSDESRQDAFKTGRITSPQQMYLCSLLQWIRNRDETIFVERKEEAARQRVEREQQRRGGSARFDALFLRLANTPFTPPPPTSQLAETALSSSTLGIAFSNTSATASALKTAVHPPRPLPVATESGDDGGRTTRRWWT